MTTHYNTASSCWCTSRVCEVFLWGYSALHWHTVSRWHTHVFLCFCHGDTHTCFLFFPRYFFVSSHPIHTPWRPSKNVEAFHSFWVLFWFGGLLAHAKWERRLTGHCNAIQNSATPCNIDGGPGVHMHITTLPVSLVIIRCMAMLALDLRRMSKMGRWDKNGRVLVQSVFFVGAVTHSSLCLSLMVWELS